jgi:hypothetical protein
MKPPSYSAELKQRAKEKKLFLCTIDVNGIPGKVGGQFTRQQAITAEQAKRLNEMILKLIQECTSLENSETEVTKK